MYLLSKGADVIVEQSSHLFRHPFIESTQRKHANTQCAIIRRKGSKMTSILVESTQWMELFLGRCKMSFHLFEQINQIKCGFIEVKNQMRVADNGPKNK